jgi:3-hydroxyisobutyrate dehydrogenase-like beta-hydroxyacid dehydrogenase
VQAIGLIGLGLLGTALAERWLQAGYSLLGYDLDSDRRAALEERGGTAAGSAAEVAAAVDVLVLSLPDSQVVAAVVNSIGDALRPDLLVIDTTTGDPEHAASLGAELARRQVGFLDATIAGSSEQVRHGQAIVLAGGSVDDFARARCSSTARGRCSMSVLGATERG